MRDETACGDTACGEAGRDEARPGAAPPRDVVLQIDNLVKHYPVRRGVVFKRTVGQVRAVDGVSLALRRGRTLGLVGESGSGKSTLAKVLVGVEAPTAGRIMVDGVDVSGMKRRQRRELRRTIQLIFQDPYTSLNPRMSVGEIVGEAFAIHHDTIPKGGKANAVKELLDLVGLNPDHVNRFPHQFSGGQRQRIGIARALAVKPKILICDEPVSALDVSIQGQVINLLERLQNELSLAYLVIAHDLSVVRHIADEVAVMYLGKVVESGTDSQVYEQTRHPYTRALMSAVPLPDPTLRGTRRPIVLDGDTPSPAAPPSGCRFHTRCWLAPIVARRPALSSAVGGGAGDGTDDVAGRGVPAVCTAVSPELEPQRSSRHLAACHFAASVNTVSMQEVGAHD